MRKVESLTIRYVGYKTPESNHEVELEILGLQTAIAAAQQRISVLKQSLKLEELLGEQRNAETVTEAPNSEEAK
jgi:hypothetical protein